MQRFLAISRNLQNKVLVSIWKHRYHSTYMFSADTSLVYARGDLNDKWRRSFIFLTVNGANQHAWCPTLTFPNSVLIFSLIGVMSAICDQNNVSPKWTISFVTYPLGLCTWNVKMEAMAVCPPQPIYRHSSVYLSVYPST